MRTFFIVIVTSIFYQVSMAQQDLKAVLNNEKPVHEPVIGTYKSPHLIMGHSIETTSKHELDCRITHRFGDFAGSQGGVRSFFGLDNAADIRISFEYGITDNLTVGAGRTKGSGDFSQLWEGLAKYRLLRQTTDDHVPVSLAVMGNVVVTSMSSSADMFDVRHFKGLSNRMSYLMQAILARKFGPRLSLSLTPTYLHRNKVRFKDMNDMFALGGSARVKVSNRFALMAEYFYPFRSGESKDFAASQGLKFYNPLGIGVEMETGGHVFQVNFTNSTAILENQLIPETTTSWLQRQYRLGFTISRRFSFAGAK